MGNNADRITHELLREMMSRNVNSSILLVCKHCEDGDACYYQLLRGTELPTRNLYAQVMMCFNSVGVLLDGVYEFYVDTNTFYDLLLSNWIGTLLTNKSEHCNSSKLCDQKLGMWKEAFSLLQLNCVLLVKRVESLAWSLSYGWNDFLLNIKGR